MSAAIARATPPALTPRLPLAATLKAGIAPSAYFTARLNLNPGALVAGPDGYAPKVRCPLHHDRTPSLSIHVQTGAWHCFGCEGRGGSVLDFEMALSKLSFDGARAALARDFGIQAEELSLPIPRRASPTHRQTPSPTPRPPLHVVTTDPAPAIPTEALDSLPSVCKGLGKPAATWVYRDATGAPVFYVWRFDRNGQGKTFRPLTWIPDPKQAGKGAWLFQDPPGSLPLYRLDQLARHPTAPVLIVEGEKAADAAYRLIPGWVTTTTAHGASATEKTDFSPLEGRSVHIWPDHDDPGRRYAEQVAHLATTSGAADVRILDLGSMAVDPLKGGKPRVLPDKWDAADALGEGWSPDALTQCARWLTVATDRPQQPPGKPDPTPPRPTPTALAVNLIRADQLRLTPVTWLWAGWLASGKLHVLAGAPGTGKTTLAMGLCATLTRGGRWPDGTRARAADVAIWSGEDDPGDTLIPRLLASGADLRRVHFVHGCSDQEGRRSFDPAHDADLLADAFSRLDSPPALLIVDPIVSAVSGDSHQGSVVRRSLQPLVDMAVARRCAILGISHFSKGTQGRDPTERVTGSLAFGALARVVLVTAKLPSTEAGGRLLARAKNNLGADAGGFCYDLEALELEEHPGIHTTRVMWGKAMEGSARDLLSLAEAPDDSDEEGSNRDVDDFVRDCLASGPLASADMQNEARNAGYSWDQVKRSSVRLGIEKQKSGFKAGWTWALPREHQSEGSTEGSEGSTQKRLLSSLPSRDSLLPSALPFAHHAAEEDQSPCHSEEF
jgi:putative DNA primase/helicase